MKADHSKRRSIRGRALLAASAFLAAGLATVPPAMAGASSTAEKFARPDLMFGGGSGAGVFGMNPFDMRNASSFASGDSQLSTTDNATPDNAGDGFSVRSEAEGNVGYDVMVTKKLVKF